MYNFIKKVKDEELVTISDILAIEKEFNFQMPEMLKEYYLSYNGASIHDCIFSFDGSKRVKT